MHQSQRVIRSLEAVTGALIGLLTACGTGEPVGQTGAGGNAAATGNGGSSVGTTSTGSGGASTGSGGTITTTGSGGSITTGGSGGTTGGSGGASTGSGGTTGGNGGNGGTSGGSGGASGNGGTSGGSGSGGSSQTGGSAGSLDAGGMGKGGTDSGTGTGGMAGSSVMDGSVSPPGCLGQTLPAVSDYGAMGPYPTTTVNNSGPDGNYTVVKPMTLGANGFKHPLATWGNGITTTPATYPGLLNTIASHGFVIVASNSTNVTAALMTTGLDWLVAQNSAAGDYQGKLNPTCLVTIGYSLGGGASVTAGSHADVVATISFHGVQGNSASLHSPLFLLTSTMDTFVSAAQFVTPTYNASTVQTFYATLTGAGDNGHLTPVGDAGVERAPAIAWLRLWVYNDLAARKYFDGIDCILCKDPWGMPQRKNWK